MPEKKKRSFYLPEDVDKQLNDYVAANYSGRDVYGAWSEVVSNAVSYYCANADTSATAPMNPHLIDDEKISKVITRIINRHKKTLDGLAEDDVKTVFTDFSNNINKELGLEDEVAYEEAKEKAEGKRRVMTPDEVVIWKYQNQKIGTDNEEVKEDV